MLYSVSISPFLFNYFLLPPPLLFRRAGVDVGKEWDRCDVFRKVTSCVLLPSQTHSPVPPPPTHPNPQTFTQLSNDGTFESFCLSFHLRFLSARTVRLMLPLPWWKPGCFEMKAGQSILPAFQQKARKSWNQGCCTSQLSHHLWKLEKVVKKVKRLPPRQSIRRKSRVQTNSWKIFSNLIIR